MEAHITEKLKRSVKLNKKQVLFLSNHVSKFETVTEAAIALKIGKDTLVRAIAFESCSEKTYNKLFDGKGK